MSSDQHKETLSIKRYWYARRSYGGAVLLYRKRYSVLLATVFIITAAYTNFIIDNKVMRIVAISRFTTVVPAKWSARERRFEVLLLLTDAAALRSFDVHTVKVTAANAALSNLGGNATTFSVRPSDASPHYCMQTLSGSVKVKVKHGWMAAINLLTTV